MAGPKFKLVTPVYPPPNSRRVTSLPGGRLAGRLILSESFPPATVFPNMFFSLVLFWLTTCRHQMSAELLSAESREVGRPHLGVLSAQKVMTTNSQPCGTFSCAVEEERRHRLETLRSRTLAGLGLHRPPNTTGVQLPKSLLKRIVADSQSDDQRHPERHQRQATRAVIKKQYKFSQPAPERLGLPPDPLRSFFNLESLAGYSIAKAILYGYIKAPEQQESGGAQKLGVHVYTYSSPTEIQDEPVGSKSLNEDLRVGQWLEFDISDLIKKWVRSPANNFGLMLKAQLNGEDLIWRHSEADALASKSMFIEIHVEEQQIRTTVKDRVGQLDCDENSLKETKCCRYPLEVNFESFGWDWIIAPKRYNAYYCAGTCPFAHESRYPVSHLLQQHLEQQNLESMTGNKWASIGPCCSPHYMREMKIIYYNEHREIIERTIPDMIVEKCSCG